MATIDAERYLNELIGRTVMILQPAGTRLYFNVLGLNQVGLLVQDHDSEYFIPWAAIVHLRLAREDEKSGLVTEAATLRQRKRHREL